MLDPEIAIRHVRRDLFMAWRDQLDVRARVIQCVEHADIAVAANPEHVWDLFFHQKLGDEFCALRHGISPVYWPPKCGLVLVFVVSARMSRMLSNRAGLTRDSHGLRNACS